MINTGYTALSNTGNMASLQAYSTSDSSPKINAANNANTYANSGVILTLSKQAISLGLASGVARTLASTSTASVLKTGSRGAAVTELQKNLTKLGYDTKGTDGIFGNDTKNAVLSFQRAHNLTADGIVGAGTQNAIAKALNYHNKGILVLGSRGAAVTELQKNLTKLGYDTKGTEGIFGAGTKNAVIAFQKDRGLSQDGMVGNETQLAIKKALETSVTTPPTYNNSFQYNWMKEGMKSSGFITKEFMQKVEDISNKLQINPDDLMAVMAFESWFDPAAKNPSSSATGLIQFMGSTAQGLGTSIEELSKMSGVEQLDYVYKHYKPYAGKMKDLSDVYMATLYPAAVGKASDYVLFSQGTDSYNSNSGLDYDKNGKVTKEEATRKVIERRKLYE